MITTSATSPANGRAGRPTPPMPTASDPVCGMAVDEQTAGSAVRDVGIAMGTGTDAAVESTGVTLVKGDLGGSSGRST
jgi:hypothetical protein